MPYRVCVTKTGADNARRGCYHLDSLDEVREDRYESEASAHVAARAIGLRPWHYRVEHEPSDEPAFQYVDEGGQPSPNGAQERAPDRRRVPPPRTTGGKFTSGVKFKTHAACIHWLRFTAKREVADQCIELLTGFFGEGEHGRGRYFQPTGHRFGTGAGVYWSEDLTVVEVCGSYCDEIGNANLRALVEAFHSLGMKATRVDLAVDLHGERVELIQKLAEECKAGKLSGARKWRPIEEIKDGERTNEGVDIGGKGKNGSGRFVRVYDKGLETKEQKERRWVRFEAEMSGDVAQQVAHELENAKDLEECIAKLAFGAFSLLERSDKNLERAQPVEWWSELIARVVGGFRRVVSHRARAEMKGTVEWVRTSVMPILRGLAEYQDMEFEEFLDLLAGDVRPKLSERGMVVAEQMKNAVAEWNGERRGRLCG